MRKHISWLKKEKHFKNQKPIELTFTAHIIDSGYVCTVYTSEGFGDSNTNFVRPAGGLDPQPSLLCLRLKVPACETHHSQQGATFLAKYQFLKHILESLMGCVTRKGPLCPESLSYQKKDGRARPRPPFFWYDTDFSKKKKSNIFQKKSNIFQKKF